MTRPLVLVADDDADILSLVRVRLELRLPRLTPMGDVPPDSA